MIYELLCQAEQRSVVCHTTDLRRIQPLHGSSTPQIYVVQFVCPNDRLTSLNLCTAGHLALIHHTDDRLQLLSTELHSDLLEVLMERLDSYEELSYEDFLREVDQASGAA